MKKGYFGAFGGCFVPELLIPPLREVEQAMEKYLQENTFQVELKDLLTNYAGRPTPITYCPNLSKELGFHLWLKREDLLHTGAHKINNALGQALLAKRMGKSQLIAETGAGQHGVATAAAAARLGLSCTIYMGAEDMERQASNVARMQLLGARVHPVTTGTRTLKDAINETLRVWITEQKTTHYCFGTAAGPHPFPTLVKAFQSVISKESIEQMQTTTGHLPNAVVACVGGGSNAIGAFANYLDIPEVQLFGIEAAGSGEPGCFNSAPLNLGTPGVLHGNYTYLLQNTEGQIEPSHSIAAGLDYPGVGPEHSYLKESGRVTYGLVKDANVVKALVRLTKKEGILPALESSHALAWVFDHADLFRPGKTVLVNLSGRGDKDMAIIQTVLAHNEANDA